MKPIILSLFLLCATTINAQTSKKSVYSKTTNSTTKKERAVTKPNSSSNASFDKRKLELGGNIQGSFSSNSGVGNSTDFGINAFAGYKFTDNVSGGVKIGTTFRTNVSNFEFGLYGRYYYDKFFGGAGLNFSNNSVKVDTGIGTYKSSYNMTYASLEGGYRIPVSDKVTIETSAVINIPFSPAGATTWFGVKAGAVYNF